MLIAQFMNEDHARLDRIFEEFRQQQSRDKAQATRLFDEFMAGLQRHILWEEELLFPIFEARTGITEGPTAVMRMEHGQIKGILEEMNMRMPGAAAEGLAELITDLLEVLGAHNQKEENILYPAIDQMLTDEDREKVRANMATL